MDVDDSGCDGCLMVEMDGWGVVVWDGGRGWGEDQVVKRETRYIRRQADLKVGVWDDVLRRFNATDGR